MLYGLGFWTSFKIFLFIFWPSVLLGQSLASNEHHENPDPNAVKFSLEEILRTEKIGEKKLVFQQATPSLVRPIRQDDGMGMSIDPHAILTNPIKRRNRLLHFL